MNNSSQGNGYVLNARVKSAAGVEWIIGHVGAPKNMWMLVSPCGEKHKHVTKSHLKKYYTIMESNNDE